ncbi:substrate-binding periplasmic protein [Alkalimarinus coralli]|uniref:substrate-binding periplasmic protein n=1 Tax=Alkalimarinus coralli TaxID=2935863 RepID=UPI00202B1DDA|nr:transporter substrate-binding domain-containing protein [Alkalimarinus coralli]
MLIRCVAVRIVFIALTFLNSVSIVSANECKELSATGNSEYPPYLWHNNGDDNRLRGAIDFIISEIGVRLSLDINLKHVGAWSRAQEEVKFGRIDMIAGAFYTTPRSQWMDYVHPPFLSTKSVVWQHKEKNFNYREKKNLVGKLGATVINNSFGQEFDEFASEQLTIEFVASLEQAFKMLILKRVDYVLYEKNPGIYYATQMRIADNIVPLSPSVSSEGLYLTISKKSKCNTRTLRAALAKVIREMIDDGYMDKALEKGFELRKR